MSQHPRIVGSACVVAAVVMASAGCGAASHRSATASPFPRASGSGRVTDNAAFPTPLKSSALQSLLLTASDLGPEYVAQPNDPAPSGGSDDGSDSVHGCPQLQELDHQNLAFPAQVEETFSYQAGSAQQLDETLGSDAPAKVQASLSKISQALASCQSFSMTRDGAMVTGTVNVINPPKLGDQQVGYLLTITAPTSTSVIKSLAIREGSVALMLSGDPAAVDGALPKAFGKIVHSGASSAG